MGNNAHSYSEPAPPLPRLKHAVDRTAHRVATPAATEVPGLDLNIAKSVTSVVARGDGPHGLRAPARGPQSPPDTRSGAFDEENAEALVYPPPCGLSRFGTVSDFAHWQAVPFRDGKRRCRLCSG